MKKKGYLDFSFSWIFALLVGGIILFGAIYGVSKFVNISETKSSVTTGTEFGTLLNPLETGIESGKSIYIKMPVPSRVNNKCEDFGTFGRQVISIDEFINKKWSNSNINVYFENKYLFSDSSSEGKGYYVFSKPFEFPFKVANLMYLIPEEDKYCFINAPEKITKELTELSQANLFAQNCSDKNYTNVCFTVGKNCDIVVLYGAKTVKKGTQISYFETDALMYAAVFSDKSVYECQTKRLMKRVLELTKIYEEKALNVQKKSCVSGVLTELSLYRTQLEAYNSSIGLSNLYTTMEDINKKNEYAKCKLW